MRVPSELTTTALGKFPKGMVAMTFMFDVSMTERPLLWLFATYKRDPLGFAANTPGRNEYEVVVLISLFVIVLIAEMPGSVSYLPQLDTYKI